MNPRTTGILLIVAAALGAFVYFYEIRGGEARREAEAAAKRIFPGIEESEIRALTLETTDGQRARIERVDGGWRLREPLDFPADPVAVDGIASNLAQLESKTVIEDAQAPEVYGLGEEARAIRFEAGEQSYELRVGDKTPVGGDTYVTTAHDPRIFTVETFKVTSMSRTLDDLRERRPLRFDRETIERIQVSWGDGGVTLERRDGGWHLVEPIEAPADADTVETLLSDLAFLRASGFIDEPPADAEMGLERPALRVVLTAAAPEEGGEPRRLELVVGDRELEDGTRPARASEPVLYKLSAARVEAIPTRVVAYREKGLSRFVTSDAERLEMIFQDLEAAEQGRSEELTVVAERGEAGWTSEPVTLAPGVAARIVSELSDLRAEDIAAESMSDSELAEVGLSPPHAILRVYGAPEDGGEAPRLAEVHLGRIDGERGIYARVPDRSLVYLLAPGEAEHLPVSFEALENRFLSKQPEAEEGGAEESEPQELEAEPGELE